MFPRIAAAVLALAFATAGATSGPDSARGASPSIGKPNSGLRLTAGLGAGSFGLAVAGRLLVVPPSTPWRFGAQGTGMGEVRLFVTPNENLGALHLIAARELVPSGPTSAQVVVGLGGASVERRGKLLKSDDSESAMFGVDEYESIVETTPSVLVGVDFGISFRRKIGISTQLGAELGGSNSAYWLLQADVGSW